MKKADCTPEQWAEQLAKWREWHQQNDGPKDAARKRDWLKADRAANPEKYNAKSRAYYAKNIEKMRERSRKKAAEWKKRNPGRQRELERAWRARNPERVRENARRQQLAKYGLTIETFSEMMGQQGELCLICSMPFRDHKRGIHVDHCHATGKVRGLLCNGCNRALGLFHDSPEMLRRAAEYIERAR